MKPGDEAEPARGERGGLEPGWPAAELATRPRRGAGSHDRDIVAELSDEPPSHPALIEHEERFVYVAGSQQPDQG